MTDDLESRYDGATDAITEICNSFDRILAGEVGRDLRGEIEDLVAEGRSLAISRRHDRAMRLARIRRTSQDHDVSEFNDMLEALGDLLLEL